MGGARLWRSCEDEAVAVRLCCGLWMCAGPARLFPHAPTPREGLGPGDVRITGRAPKIWENFLSKAQLCVRAPLCFREDLLASSEKVFKSFPWQLLSKLTKYHGIQTVTGAASWVWPLFSANSVTLWPFFVKGWTSNFLYTYIFYFFFNLSIIQCGKAFDHEQGWWSDWFWASYWGRPGNSCWPWAATIKSNWLHACDSDSSRGSWHCRELRQGGCCRPRARGAVCVLQLHQGAHKAVGCSPACGQMLMKAGTAISEMPWV